MPPEKKTTTKNTVKPSVNSIKVPKPAESIKPLPVVKDYAWYLKNKCGGNDTYVFDTHAEAYKFGWDLRDKHGDSIRVEISLETVRVFSI